jgi:hypothetical protein
LEAIDLNDAMDALDLSQYWGLKELNEQIQVTIIKRNLITPRSYEESMCLTQFKYIPHLTLFISSSASD